MDSEKLNIKIDTWYVTYYGGEYVLDTYIRDMNQYSHILQWTLSEEAIMLYSEVVGDGDRKKTPICCGIEANCDKRTCSAH